MVSSNLKARVMHSDHPQHRRDVASPSAQELWCRAAFIGCYWKATSTHEVLYIRRSFHSHPSSRRSRWGLYCWPSSWTRVRSSSTLPKNEWRNNGPAFYSYKGKEDLTKSRFAVHPKIGERVYRTGDRGKLLLDGSVVLLGRMDREVKLRGAIHETIQFWLCMSHELWPLDVGYRSASVFLNQEEY